ncbi:hypothetical protein BCR32DRAFT_293641 [Anaeromyces robustus]|uniref:Uncharacterized protein n=1 Tax=Anaeromyces robustus TaxID=1754192 RepID=A0A1Y1X557_9FUNG|nr:hypothetical protein BCR32DRAFT_293641 [Anaeromyces robustus]|eukprot:ORX80788.1 hypothetical protein BCR32DRAFT_293641 [Anaeromyces robustus]
MTSNSTTIDPLSFFTFNEAANYFNGLKCNSNKDCPLESDCIGNKCITEFYCNYDDKCSFYSGVCNGKPCDSVECKVDSDCLKSRNYLKLNLEFPEYSKSFRWILRARFGYKIDARVAKAAKMINNSCPNCYSCCFHCDSYQRIDHWFINCFLFKNLHSLFNSLVRTSNNPSGYKSSNNMRINSLSNIDILGNQKIVNRDYGFSDRINNSPYKKEWECLFKCQTESGTYSKSLFLLRSAALLNDIIPVVCLGQPSKANADPISDPNGIG